MSAKAAHTNMMTDCIIANLPPEVLRSITRGLLGGDPKITATFQSLVSNHLTNTQPEITPRLFTVNKNSLKPLPALDNLQSRYRCLMGCGRGFESIGVLGEVLQQLEALKWDGWADHEEFLASVALIDGDVVQAVTAVQKQLITTSGARYMSSEELKIVSKLRESLENFRSQATEKSFDFPFERGLKSVEALISEPYEKTSTLTPPNPPSMGFTSSDSRLESFTLGTAVVPRMLCGLWQFSSPAWGTASKAKIDADFRKHVDAGLVAYDMADHYGDAEVTFGQFRSTQPDSSSIYCATKWCVFEPMKISKEVVDSKIQERLTLINATQVELLQFHWQDYDNHQYVEAARLIEANSAVRNLGLCNFDTEHMDEIIESAVSIVSNQVQFSLIDLRPTFKMADSCNKYKVKLLTYGSLCGGFLANKWLGKSAPNLFDKEMTPSHRKYLEMITVWGGWSLFQELLMVLFTIGQKYSVSVSSVAVRWLLDHDFVGAVIIGSRMGISEHIEENLKVFSFRLDQDDRKTIGKVLERSKAKDVFEAMGDCGAEYRQ